MPNAAIVASAAAGSGRFTPSIPTLTYAGSGTTNNGKFTITNYNSSFIYSVSGNGSITSNTLTVNSATTSVNLTVKSPKGVSFSSSITAFRQAATQYFVQTGAPYCCNDGFCAGCFGGCGTFYAAGKWCAECGDGYWSCGTPGYNAYTNYSANGYTWSGSNYTNGQGEWWKIS